MRKSLPVMNPPSGPMSSAPTVPTRDARGSCRGECVKLPSDAGAIGGDAIAPPSVQSKEDLCGVLACRGGNLSCAEQLCTCSCSSFYELPASETRDSWHPLTLCSCSF